MQLEEGPRMATNLVDDASEALEIGTALQADFEDISDDITLVVFRRR